MQLKHLQYLNTNNSDHVISALRELFYSAPFKRIITIFYYINNPEKRPNDYLMNNFQIFDQHKDLWKTLQSVFIQI